VVYRIPRLDIGTLDGNRDIFAGFQVEFIGDLNPGKIEVRVDGKTIASCEGPAGSIRVGDTPYCELLNSDQVLGKKQIYGSGPPSQQVHSDVLAFARRLPPPILDFGCGAGALVRELRRSGVEAYGIELKRPAIEASLDPEARPYVTLYTGGPLPFQDGSFESVSAIEVIEHIPEYALSLSEIARVCRSTFAITVPDMSAVPLGAHLGIVPWHLLEDTHFNFFNFRSLTSTLLPHFRDVSLFRIASTTVSGDFLPGSVAAIARK
jgi:SAM-dependent methyltransferase